MKKVIIALTLGSSLTMFSCKKEIYGCTDNTAENYSTYATVDDGSCYHYTEPVIPSQDANIESDQFTISSWTWSDPSYYKAINYTPITQDVLDDGAVLVYISVGSSQWSQLPVTFYPSDTYSTSLEVTSSLGQVTIFWTDSDHLTLNPGTWTFKIVVIQNVGMMTNNERDIYNIK
ncbi:MAG: hypothetical protein IPM74_11165 [Crocinitomicaceae bacterium]|nr:hypothetical protein [Crocinitomicaceae bacterium]MBK8926441.1 hypothetical protein [Crocinitomicaceae bacterium]